MKVIPTSSYLLITKRLFFKLLKYLFVLCVEYMSAQLNKNERLIFAHEELVFEKNPPFGMEFLGLYILLKLHFECQV